MPDILIVGGGFAAVWAAAAAARRRLEAGAGPEDLTIALLAPGADLVIRPRLYEPDPGAMRVPLHRILEPIGVGQVRATAEDADVLRSRVTAVGAGGARIVLHYGRLVIAAGSRLVRADIPGAELLHDVDTLPAAVALDEHLHRLPDRAPEGRYTAVVIGAGFAGLEVATELVGRLRAISGGAGRVVLVERGRHVGGELGSGPRPVIEDALDELGVERRLGTTVTGLDGQAVELSSGERIPAQTAIWTAGMAAAPIAARVPGRHDLLGRLAVDRCLRVRGLATVYAAGDTASVEVHPGQLALQACQYAHQTGKPAGRNAASDLLGLPPAAFSPEPYVTCLDLGAAGAVYTEGHHRRVFATGEAAKEIKRRINRELIYPPLDDAEAILERAGESRPAVYSSPLT